MQTVIAAVTHKHHNMPDDGLYLPVMAGAIGMSAKDTEDYVRDDHGDNISDKNSSYCELTALYWMWKNCDADNIGICHYRRYFAGFDAAEMQSSAMPLRLFASIRQGIAGLMRGRDEFAGILSAEEADAVMSQYPLVLPRARNYHIETNYSQYAHAHDAADLDEVRDIIAAVCPEYLDAFDGRMSKTSGHRFNMFIMRRELLDEYCSWLFDILFELERRRGDADDHRLYGYIGERLLDVWLDAKGHSYTELPYVFIGNEQLLRKAAALLLRKLRSPFIKRSGSQQKYR